MIFKNKELIQVKMMKQDTLDEEQQVTRVVVPCGSRITHVHRRLHKETLTVA